MIQNLHKELWWSYRRGVYDNLLRQKDRYKGIDVETSIKGKGDRAENT